MLTRQLSTTRIVHLEISNRIVDQKCRLTRLNNRSQGNNGFVMVGLGGGLGGDGVVGFHAFWLVGKFDAPGILRGRLLGTPVCYHAIAYFDLLPQLFDPLLQISFEEFQLIFADIVAFFFELRVVLFPVGAAVE